MDMKSAPCLNSIGLRIIRITQTQYTCVGEINILLLYIKYNGKHWHGNTNTIIHIDDVYSENGGEFW